MAASQAAGDPGTPKRRSRRSWFDAPPLTTLEPPPVLRPEPKSSAPKRRSLDTVETLTLTHFTNPPRIEFGKILVGRTKFRTLLIRNPHDYEQEVVIERFPFKKKFMVDQTRFTVGPGDIFSLEITWTPEDKGGFREMIQFHINEVYRLQAFLIGIADKPKPQRKVKKHGIGPRIKQPPTVVQTPALTSIKASYSPRRSQEAQDLLEEMAQRTHGENKENSGNLVSRESRYDVIGISEGTVMNGNKDTARFETVSNFVGSTKQENTCPEDDMKSPIPLESTTIAEKEDRTCENQKNRRQWRKISDITSPTLNTMSPIPLTEGNENGITVDSYFQPHEVTTDRAVVGKFKTNTGDMTKERKMAEPPQAVNGDLKDTFVMPLAQPDQSGFTKIRSKEKEIRSTEDKVSVTLAENTLTSTVSYSHSQEMRVDETRVIKRDETHLVKSADTENQAKTDNAQSKKNIGKPLISSGVTQIEMQRRTNWSSPQTPQAVPMARKSPASPGTMLNEALSLVSQIKVPMKSPVVSPSDGNASINSSIISQGHGMVSPNSFLEDMKSMKRGRGGDVGKKDASTSSIPSPSTVLNNSVPHNAMVKHLKTIRSSLSESPQLRRTPTKPAGAKIGPKRRSITSQFLREEMKKGQETREKFMTKKANQRESVTSSRAVPSPRRGTFVCRKKEPDHKTGGKKKSPITKKRSPKRSTQELAMTRVRSKVGDGKNGTRKSAKPSTKVSHPDLSKSLKTKSSAAYLEEKSSDETGAVQKNIDAEDIRTPQKGEVSLDSGTVIKSRSFDTETVVKGKSFEDSSNRSGRFFDDLLPAQEGGPAEHSQNSSVARRGKLFPDIDVSETEKCGESNTVAEAKEKDGSEDDKCRQIVQNENNVEQNAKQGSTNCSVRMAWKSNFKNKDCQGSDFITFKNNHTAEASPRKSRIDRVWGAAERSMSPQRFCSMSPSRLPTSPGVGLEQSRRGTMTVTKSRPSDALLTAMNNRKNLFKGSPSSHPIREDDTETQENIHVKVEEHYEEIDGQMFVVVKETTDVIKSTTETYIEHLAVSPQQFQTPTRLPNSPDPQMSRRSTHVVRSPKVIDVASMKTKRLDFCNEHEEGCQPNGNKERSSLPQQQSQEEMDRNCNTSADSLGADSVDSIHESSKIKSDTFEKEATVLATPDKIGSGTMAESLSVTKEGPPITSVCVMSPRLVDYDDVASESGSAADVTKDSLDTTQSVDSLNQSCMEDKTANSIKEKRYNNGEKDRANDVIDDTKISLPSSEEKGNYCITNLAESDGKKEDRRSAASDASEEEKYYDTMSERYYDALSDTVGMIDDEDFLVVGDIEAMDACLENLQMPCLQNGTQRVACNNVQSCEQEMSNQHPNYREEERFDDVQNTVCLGEYKMDNQMAMFVENSTERKEQFEIVEKETFVAHTPCTSTQVIEITPIAENEEEKIISTTSADKSEDKEIVAVSPVVKTEETEAVTSPSKAKSEEKEPGVTSFVAEMEEKAVATAAVAETEGKYSTAPTLKDKCVKKEETAAASLAEAEDKNAAATKSDPKSKRKLRRSVSADVLLPSSCNVDVSNPGQCSRTDNKKPAITKATNVATQKAMVQSKSAVFAKPAQQLLRKNSQTKLMKSQPSSVQGIPAQLKQRSQSLTCLSRQTDKDDKQSGSSRPVTRSTTTSANQSIHSASKKKGVPKGVAQSKLILVKKPKTGAPRHPMLFAARNMYYDERWIEKQERGFVQWLNFVLTPPDEYVAVTSKAKVDAGSLTLDSRHVAPRLAPTKEILSFRSYAARRRLNRLRRTACELYQSEQVVNIIRKIEVEVESRRIAVRKEKMVHADLGIKQQLLDLLLHYSSLWLRIGLETVFGEVLMLQSNTDVVGLSRFIVTRLLASPDIAEEFAHPTVPHLYKDGYAGAVSRHTVKKFLLLVYFLDQAKSSRLIDHDPCLFCKDAEIKSSKEILIQFSRGVLSGEGDITRHLAYLGYTVTQTQKPIDEFDFAVKTLSSDLRDGLRLCRILELLAGNQMIMGKLRAPAISRLQKIHNTENFFKAMAERGMNFSNLPGTQVTVRDVVDGHREKTLTLLWHLIIHFQSSILVNEEQLKEEIDMLIKSLQLKLAMQKIGVLSLEECQARRDSGETKLLLENQRLQLIFQWCRLVCLHYGVKIENFTVSFSDGRALCCLLHHYHPALLPLSQVHFQTTVSLQEAAENCCDVETDPDLSIDWGTGGGLMPEEDSPGKHEELLANEKANFKLLYEKVSALGGVPLMLRFADMSNTIPDEKVVSTYLSYLCARLLDIREEVKAARAIQMAWRRRQLRLAVKERQRRTKAALVIQQWIRPYLSQKMESRQIDAAIRIQSAWRRHLAQGHLKQLKEEHHLEALWVEREEAAVTIQNLWRGLAARRHLVKLREDKRKNNELREKEAAAIFLQKSWKGMKTRQEFLKQRGAAVRIQANWRRYMALKIKESLKREKRHNSAIVIQKWMRRQFCVKTYERKRRAALDLQKAWRMKQAKLKLAVLRLEKQNKAAVVIQKFVRCKTQEKLYKKLKRAALTLQSQWRVQQAKTELARLRYERDNKCAKIVQSVIKSALCRKEFLKKRNATLSFQKNWRRVCAQRQLTALKMKRNSDAAVVIQKYYRGCKVKQEFFIMKKAALIVQSAWRKKQAKRELERLVQEQQEKSAVVIQKMFKGFKCRQELKKCKAATLRIQKAWRMHVAKEELRKLKIRHQEKSATIIQKTFRGFLCRQEFKMCVTSAVRIQKTWRMHLAKKELETLRAGHHNFSARVIQKHFKGYLARKSYLKLKSSAIIIQKNWRMVEAVKECRQLRYEKHNQAALLLQRHFKGLTCKKSFIRLKMAAIVFQKSWRRIKAERLLITLRLEKQEKSAILIQKAWRQFSTRQKYLEMKRAAVILQSNWKMVLLRRQLCRMRNAALVIQSQHRANVLARQEHQSYLSLKKCAVCIQSFWRCKMERKKFLRLKWAAVAIQSNFRCFRRRLKFLAVKLATIIVQQAYRNYVKGRRVRQEYLAQKRAAVIIQRSYRRVLLERQIKQNAAVLVLQTAFRKCIARNRYIAQQTAAVIIQDSFRGYQKMKSSRQDFLKQKQAVAVIQSGFRVYKLRKEYRHVCQSIIKLQAFVRCKQAQKQYKTLRKASLTIQRKYRATQEGKVFRQAFLLIRKSTITIQRFYRAVKVRRQVQGELLRQNLAATKIQSLYRGWSLRQDYLLMAAAVVCFQRRFRALQMGRTVRKEVNKMRKAACVVQRSWRGYKQIQIAREIVQNRREEMMRERERRLQEERLEIHRKEEEKRIELEKKVEDIRRNKAAVLLQRSVRAFLVMKDYMRRENAALLIQKHIRSYQARQKYVATLKSVQMLQRLVKGFAYRRQFERMRLAATMIQMRWREILEGRRLRAEFISKQNAAVVIQTYCRMRSEREKFKESVRKITLVQACIKKFTQRQKYIRIKRTIIFMQRKVLSKQAMLRDRNSFLKIRHSAIKIQSIIRMWLACRYVQKEKSIIKIQTYWRMYQQRQAFNQAYGAVQVLRHFMSAKQQQLERRVQERAAYTIQQAFRNYQVKKLERANSAACVIQYAVRKYLYRQQEAKHSAALVVQRTVRKFVMKKKIIKVKSVVVIQTAVRGFVQRRKYLKLLDWVVMLQARIRGWQARLLADALKKRKEATVCIQAYVRGYLTRKKICPILNERLEAIQEEKRQHRASIRIQALWRGFITRRDTKCKKLAQTRKRLEQANRSATHEKTLGSRTSSALDYLLRERDLAYILEALVHLEVSTRLSPVCCERMVEVNAVSVLYRLINSCNRSVPHMELIQYSVSILLNLAKYEKTVEDVMKPEDSLHTLVELLQIYREKGGIFFNTCMLIGILGLSTHRRMKILQYPLIVEKLQSIHALTVRKQRANQSRQLTKAKMAAMRSFNYTLPVLTPTKSKPRKIRPQWVLAKGGIKDFDDPLAAVTFVMNILQIGPKV